MASTSYDKIISADLIAQEQNQGSDEEVDPRPWEIHKIPYVVLHVRPEVIIGVTVINNGKEKKYKDKKRLFSSSKKIKPLKLVKTSRTTYRVDSRLRSRRGWSGRVTQCRVVLERIKLPVSHSDKNFLMHQSSLRKMSRKSERGLLEQLAGTEARVLNNISPRCSNLLKVNFQQCRVVLERIVMNPDSNGNILYTKDALSSASKSVRFQQYPSISHIPNRCETELDDWLTSGVRDPSSGDLSIFQNDRLLPEPFQRRKMFCNQNSSNVKKVKALTEKTLNKRSFRSLHRNFVGDLSNCSESRDSEWEKDSDVLRTFRIKECCVRLERISPDVINASRDSDLDKSRSNNFTAGVSGPTSPLKSILKSPDRSKENSVTRMHCDVSTPGRTHVLEQTSDHSTPTYCVSKICTFPTISLRIKNVKKPTLNINSGNHFNETFANLTETNNNIVENIKLKECRVVLNRMDVGGFL